MAADSQLALQEAVHDALISSAALTALLHAGAASVFDHVPPGSLPPYVVLGDSSASEWDTQTSDGMEQTLTIHTWSEHRGMAECKRIMAAIVDALDQASLTVTGHVLVVLRFEFSDTFLDPDGFTRHGVQRFRALTQEAP